MKVITWLWSQPGGRATYHPWHVRVWASMIKRHLSLDHTLAVVTDLPGDYGSDVEVIKPPGEFEDVRIPTWKEHRPQCLRRLAMFRRDADTIFGAERLVCTDLDLVVCGSLDPVLDIQDDFKITRGTHRARAYNGSMISLKLGSRTKVYEEFTPERAIVAGRGHVGSDQAWIAHSLPGEKTWGPEDGVCFWMTGAGLDKARVVFFAGQTKPWHVASDKPSFISANYRCKQDGQCLLLGYSPTLWDEVAAAIDRGYSFSSVIASPEAARHWPGKVLAVAADDEDAERLAYVHGFDRVVWCGKSEGSQA
jgi:hypothetical protein